MFSQQVAIHFYSFLLLSKKQEKGAVVKLSALPKGISKKLLKEERWLFIDAFHPQDCPSRPRIEPLTL